MNAKNIGGGGGDMLKDKKSIIFMFNCNNLKCKR